jgi:hypothetical protein
MYHDSELRRITCLFGDAVGDGDTFLPSLPNCNVRLYHGGIYVYHNGEGAACYMFGKDITKIRLVESDNNGGHNGGHNGTSLLALTLSTTAPVLGAVNHYTASRQATGERELGLLLPRGSSTLETIKDAYRRWTRTEDAPNTHDDQSQGVTESPQSSGLVDCRRVSADTNGREGYGLLKNCFDHALPATWDQDCVRYVHQCLEIDVRLTGKHHSNNSSHAAESKSQGTETTSPGAKQCETWATQQSTNGSIPLILVAGVPGSGKREFAHVLKDRLRDEFTWTTVQTTVLPAELTFDARTMVASLSNIATGSAGSSATSPKPVRALLVLPGATTVAEAVHVIGAHAHVSKLFHVTATVGCVNAPLSSRRASSTSPDADADADDQLHLLPGIVEQVRQGWTTHIVVFGADRSSSTPSRHVAVRHHLKQVNADANMILAQGMTLASTSSSAAPSPGSSSTKNDDGGSGIPGTSVLGDVLMTRDQLMDIASLDTYSSPTFVNGRRFQTVSQGTTKTQWQSVSTTLNGYLHRDRFVSALAALTHNTPSTTLSSTPAPEPAALAALATPTKKKGGFMSRLQNKAKAKVFGGVDLTKGGFDAVKMPNATTVDTETWYVEATVAFCEYPERWFKCNASHGQVWCQDVTEKMQAQLEKDPSSLLTNQVLFVGPQVDTFWTSGQRTNYKQAVVDMVSSCAPPLPTKKAQRTRRMLNREEIQSVDLSHREINAGDGWYFDGRIYVGPTGNTSNEHPKLEMFLKEYLVEQNEGIAQYNNHVQARRSRSELARKGEQVEDVQDLNLYVEEERQRISGRVAVVAVGSATAVSSPSMKHRVATSGSSTPSSGLAFETKDGKK